MSNLIQLRRAARAIFDTALSAADAGAALKQAIRLEDFRLEIRGLSFELRKRNVYSIAIGKAAAPMAAALEDILGTKLTAGLVAGPSATSRHGTHHTNEPGERWHIFESGHPLPNEASLLAADAAFDLLRHADHENALLIFLVSGGGSAMIESPINPELTLADLREANRILIASGASIGEINSVRRGLSAIKGGRLAARAPNCDQVTLIVSDVPTGEERNVASGPTLTPTEDALNPLEVITHHDLQKQLPLSVWNAIEAQKPLPSSQHERENYHVLLDNSIAIEAAQNEALSRGYKSEIARDICDQPIEAGCEKLLQRLAILHASSEGSIESDVCLISGGEFSCPIRGRGLGGRNLESALRLAIAADSTALGSGGFVALCAGTDGIDGNSPAAGAVVDSTTMKRARGIGLDPQDFLNRSDAYSFFVALGDVITTGATGTNVRDLRILLSGRAEKTD